MFLIWGVVCHGILIDEGVLGDFLKSECKGLNFDLGPF